MTRPILCQRPCSCLHNLGLSSWVYWNFFLRSLAVYTNGTMMYPVVFLIFLFLGLRITRPTAWIISIVDFLGSKKYTASRSGISTPVLRIAALVIILICGCSGAIVFGVYCAIHFKIFLRLFWGVWASMCFQAHSVRWYFFSVLSPLTKLLISLAHSWFQQEPGLKVDSYKCSFFLFFLPV